MKKLQTKIYNLQTNGGGFTLIELLVVISIIGVLSSVVMVNVNKARMKAQDARRLSDMHQMQIALNFYYDSFGRYPASDGAGIYGYDTSGTPVGAPSFLTPLVSNNFLPAHLLDPITNNEFGNYVYYRYSAGYYGCTKAFYVLAVRDMETSNNPHQSSPGWSCPLQNWQDQFDWVTGEFE
ncbi:type II secretion system GspH family protein [Patescibacteria group bacterium]|nr:type II secretion system GspH family protein [Patescibacteria group bacterium]